MGKKILIVGAGILQLPMILKAKEMDLEVAVLDRNPNAVGIPYADKYYEVSTVDKEGVLASAKDFHADGIGTMATDMPMRAISYACSKLGLPSISEKCALKCTDKLEMLIALDERNVPCPKYYVINNQEEAIKINVAIDYPCIVKPTDSSGSRGVTLVNHSEELYKAIEYARNVSNSKKILIEEYLRGEEVSVEVFVVDGIPHVLQITDKLTDGAPHFVEQGHSQPSKLSNGAQEEIKKVACAACIATGITLGPAHVELKVMNNQARIIELGARMGGDCITSHLVPLSTGIDMTKLTIKSAIGEDVLITPASNKCCAIRFIPCKKGRLISIDTRQAKQLIGVKYIEFFKSKGDLISDVESSSDRLGYVISVADTVDEAIEICEKAIGRITIMLGE